MSSSGLLLLLTLFVATTLSSAIPKPGEEGGKEHKDSADRVLHKGLSDIEHEAEGDHNAEYDHDAFLGHEEAQTFDQLSQEESRDRLGIIYDKIDGDSDGFVSEEELIAWIRRVQRNYILKDTTRQWDEHDAEEDGTLHWDSYKKRTYGYQNEEELEDDDGYNLKDMLKRDLRRWEKADKNEDKKMTKEEFQDFLHPEEVEHMRDIVVDETLEDIDKDGDGKISLNEYIADMWPQQDDEEEPDWVKTEREQFSNFRDKNKNGEMDREEVKDWIIPPDYDHSEAEAKHLVFESDTNRDGKLTKEEVLDKSDLFVGSQATDFGEALTNHEEL